MPLGNLSRAYLSGFPVGDHPHTWRSPTIYRWGEVAGGRQDGRRNFVSTEVAEKSVVKISYLCSNNSDILQIYSWWYSHVRELLPPHGYLEALVRDRPEQAGGQLLQLVPGDALHKVAGCHLL